MRNRKLKVYVLHYGSNTSSRKYTRWADLAADMKAMLEDGWAIRGVAMRFE